MERDVAPGARYVQADRVIGGGYFGDPVQLELPKGAVDEEETGELQMSCLDSEVWRAGEESGEA